jgi:methylglutaconyl-CoA hydratase
MTSTLRITEHSATRTITLARAELRNAFDEQMIAEITAAFRDASADPKVRIVVLAAAGKAFCAGADLSWMRRMAGFSDAENQRDARLLATMLHTIYHCPKPVIARVQGDCYAGGMGLVAASDFAVAAERAQFCLSEVRLGLIPATIAPYVVRQMGQAATRRYMLTAERFSAARAAALGLVQEVLAEDQLDAVIERWCAALLANSPAALAAAKRLLHDVTQAPLEMPLIDETARRIAAIRASSEGREGIAAFLEKRAPAWAVALP